MRECALGNEHSIKLGWARVNFNYFLDESEFQFIVDAVMQIASHGWKLLPFYRLDTQSGQYIHRTFDRYDNLRLMTEIEFRDGFCSYKV